jgi:hypothetical protein
MMVLAARDVAAATTTTIDQQDRLLSGLRAFDT